MWLLGFLSASVGIVLGGTIAWLFKGLQQKVHIIYGLCAGIIFGLISLEILPESIELGGSLKTIVGFMIGMILFKVLHNGVHNYGRIKGTSKKKRYIRTSILLMCSFSIHNVPMGIMLGVSQQSDLTMAVLQALLFHSIPEGIILFTPLLLAGISVFMGLFVALLVSIPIPVGVWLGSYFGGGHQFINTTFMSVTLGVIFMVTVSEMLVPALVSSSKVKVLTCTLIGLAVIGGYLKFL